MATLHNALIQIHLNTVNGIIDPWIEHNQQRHLSTHSPMVTDRSALHKWHLRTTSTGLFDLTLSLTSAGH
jgi:hypothetical protein